MKVPARRDGYPSQVKLFIYDTGSSETSLLETNLLDIMFMTSVMHTAAQDVVQENTESGKKRRVAVCRRELRLVDCWNGGASSGEAREGR